MGWRSLFRSFRAKTAGLVGICTGIRLLLFISYQPWVPQVEQNSILKDDALGYHQLANLIVKNFDFSQNFDVNAIRTPAYPFFISAVYSIFGSKPWIVFLFQIALDACSCFFLIKLFAKISNETIAIYAAIFFALDPFLALHSLTLLTESLFIFFLTLILYVCGELLSGTSDKKRTFLYVTLGLLLGVATLVRPILQYIPIILCVYFLFCFGLKRVVMQRCAIMLVVFSAVISVWLFRNYVTYGAWSISTAGDYNVVLDVMMAESAEHNADPETVKQEIFAEADSAMKQEGVNPETANPFVKGSYWKSVAMKYLLRNPLSFVRAYLKGMVGMLFHEGTAMFSEVFHVPMGELHLTPRAGLRSYWDDAVSSKGIIGIAIIAAVSIYLFFSYGLTVVGLLASWKRFNLHFLILALFLTMYFIGISGALATVRFKLPAIPCYCIFAGIGTDYLMEKVRAQKARRNPVI
jgi:4-amino-4-deoxy-L-arabinose transferase-like glycosyltransferase